MTSLKDLEPIVTVALFESTQEGFFENGATIFGSVTLPVKPFAAPGHYVATGTVSSILATSLDQTPFALLPESNIPLEQKRNAWTLDFTFDQYVWWSDATKQGWGFFGSFGVSDTNPSFLDVFGQFGAGGSGPFDFRVHDSWGAGYYYAGVTDVLRESLSPFVRLRNEHGFEAFYNFAVTGWSNVTADLQFIDPFGVGAKTRTFFSVRWKLTF